MISRLTKYTGLAVFLCISLAFSLQAQTLKRKANFNLNWKFYKGSPTGGTPSDVVYNDSGNGWSKVNIPHSASYDAPDYNSETSFYKGDCWYRRTFGVPSEAKKVFIEFEGAMQTATVYVNGNKVGIHNNSGYTPFYFDITSVITRGAGNVVALELNNAKSSDIPPGHPVSSSGADFYLYSGLYRSVWLHFKDSVYVPIYSQHIWTEGVSSGSARIHGLTPVKNDAPAEKSVQVAMTLFDSSRAAVVSQSATAAIPANTLDTFDLLTDAFAPNLWSPARPYLYSVQTVVRVDGKVADSVVEPCGVRSMTWNAQGFHLNGSRLEIRGMCVHQFEGWIENAVPDSRYYQEVKQLKGIGCNSIRCAHYPRSQAFYDACDKLGMLVYVEIPTWGWGFTPNTTCWARLDSCMKEMILSARNHPCIYIWGLYNEPVPNPYVSFESQITNLNKRAHSLDTTRLTATANINSTQYGAPNGWNASIEIPDIVGLNYSTSYSNKSIPLVNTESSDDFYRQEARGSANDLDTGSKSYLQREWDCMAYTMSTSGQLAGGHFWCFKDYNSAANKTGWEGIVDRLTLPKTVFYKFRYMWTGQAPDYPKSGTATKIELAADTNSLFATGADVFLLTATMRDDGGRQIATATDGVTFTVSPAGAGAIFGGNKAASPGGRAGALLRTTTAPANPITVTAAYEGLPSATIQLTTLAAVDEVPLLSQSEAMAQAKARDRFKRLTIAKSAQGLVVQCPIAHGRLCIIDCQGRSVFSTMVTTPEIVFKRSRAVGVGIYHCVWSGNGRRDIVRMNTVY